MRRSLVLAIATLAACDPTPAMPDAPTLEGPDAAPPDLGAPPCTLEAPEASVRIDARSDRGALPSLQGFLHGLDPTPGSTASLDAELVGAFAPRFWRIGTGADVILPRIRGFGATITFVVSDGYADLRGGYSSARPWEDWAGYDAYVDALAEANVAEGRPITYYDVWGEPQGGTPWLGSYDDLLTLFARTITRIRAIDPEARFVGPSYDDFFGEVDGHGAVELLADLDRLHGLRLEAVSWHELGARSPDDLPERVQALRAELARVLPGHAPELHVNEYAGPADHLLPGAAVVWLHALHEADVDVASRACWDVPGEGWSDCWAGLNGLLRPDGRTPQHSYHSHRAYAELVGHRWLATEPSDPRIVALAVSRGDDVLVLSGRAGGALEGRAVVVRFEIEGLEPSPHDALLELRRVPIDGIPGPLLETVDSRCVAHVEGGRLAISIPDYADGSAVSLRVPDPPSE